MSLEKEFIPYEQALALKELGFDEPCFGYFYTKDKFFDTKIKNSQLDEEVSVSSPLYQQAFQFLFFIIDDIISITYFFDGSGSLKRNGEGFYFYFKNREDCLIELINLVKLKK